MEPKMAHLVDSHGNIEERREMLPDEIKELNSRLSHKITSLRWEWAEEDLVDDPAWSDGELELGREEEAGEED
jgi:hypothetical protein